MPSGPISLGEIKNIIASIQAKEIKLHSNNNLFMSKLYHKSTTTIGLCSALLCARKILNKRPATLQLRDYKIHSVHLTLTANDSRNLLAPTQQIIAKISPVAHFATSCQTTLPSTKFQTSKICIVEGLDRTRLLFTSLTWSRDGLGLPDKYIYYL